MTTESNGGWEAVRRQHVWQECTSHKAELVDVSSEEIVCGKPVVQHCTHCWLHRITLDGASRPIAYVIENRFVYDEPDCAALQVSSAYANTFVDAHACGSIVSVVFGEIPHG